MLDVCAKSYKYALEAFEEDSQDKALRVIEKETQADQLELMLRTKHIKRLANNQCNAEAGIVWMRLSVWKEFRIMQEISRKN